MAVVSFRESSSGSKLGEKSFSHKMAQNSKILAAFGGGDEHSIDFSVESDLFEKLGVHRAKLGEENAFNIDKVYRHQLERDIDKIKQYHGSYRQRDALYTSVREDDPFYALIALPSHVGAEGDFSQLLPYCAEESWRSTSQPYGVIAHKQYLDYIANLPKGPSNEEIQDRLQRTMDKEVWEKVVTGQFEPTKRELLSREERKLKQELALAKKRMVNEEEEKRKARELAFAENEFHKLRGEFVNEKEIEKGANNWDKGIHKDYDLTKGMPYVVQFAERVSDVRSRMEKDKQGPKKPPVFSSDLFVRGNIGNEKQYADFLCDMNLNKAKNHLKQHRRQLEKEKKMKELEAKEMQKNRRRAGLRGVSIADQMLKAKIAASQNAIKSTLKVKGNLAQGETDIERDAFLAADGELEGLNVAQQADELLEEHEFMRRLVPKIKAIEVLQEEALDGESSSGDDDDDDESSDDDSESDESKHKPRNYAGKREEEGGDNAEGAMDLHGGFLSFSPSTPAPIRALSQMHHAFSRTIQRFGLSRGDAQSLYAAPPANNKRKKKSNSGNNNTKNKRVKRNTIVPTEREAEAGGGFIGGAALRENWENYWEDTDFSREAWGEWISQTTPVKLANRVRRRVQRMYTFLYDDTQYKTRSEREKEKEINRLRDMAERINEEPFRERVMDFAPGELSMQEFMREAKKKNNEFRKAIDKLTRRGRLKKHEVRNLELLEMRHARLLEMVKERKSREREALQVIDIMQSLIAREQAIIEEREIPRDEQLLSLFMNRFVKRRAGAQQEKVKKLSKLLPPSDAKYDEEEVRNLVRLRIIERDLEKKKKHFIAWLLKRPVKVKKEKDERKYVDDLIIAAQTGDYRAVLDVLDVREKIDEDRVTLADLNAVGGDQTTAMFSVLYNVIKREMTRENIDLSVLLLSPMERFFKRFMPEKPQIMETERFDLVIQILLHYGGDLMFPKVGYGVEGKTVFHHAVQSGVFEVVEFLLDRGMDVNHLTTVHRRSPLMLAVERDNLDMAMFLLEHGAMLSIPHVDNLGCNVLHYAARHASPLLTEILLMCGALNDVRNARGYLPSEEAKMRNRLELSLLISTFDNGLNDKVLRISTLLKNLQQYSSVVDGGVREDILGEIPVDADGQQERLGEVERESGDLHNRHFAHGHSESTFRVDGERGEEKENAEQKGREMAAGATMSERQVNRLWGTNEKTRAERFRTKENQRAQRKQETKKNVLSSMVQAINRDTVLAAPSLRKTMMQLGLVKNSAKKP